MEIPPTTLAQARQDSTATDAVVSGLARALLEAADGQRGAKYTLRRALAQADAPAASAAELRRRVLTAIACDDCAVIAGMVAGNYPGLVAHLQQGAAATAGAPPDVLPFEMKPGGEVVFDLPASTRESTHLPYLIGRWLGAMPVFAAYAAAGHTTIGRTAFNLGGRQKQPGIGYIGNRAAAWLIPDPDFLATRGHARTRKTVATPEWASRANTPYLRARPEERSRVEATLAGAATLAPDASNRPGDHRAAIELDATASSATLFPLLIGGCAVLRVASADRSRIWLDSRLVAWTHYIPVAADLSDLAERVAWVAAHDDEAHTIGAAGRRLALGIDFSAELAAAAVAVGAALRGK